MSKSGTNSVSGRRSLPTLVLSAVALIGFSTAPVSAFGASGAISGTYSIEAPVAPVYCYGSASLYGSGGNQLKTVNFGPGTGVHQTYRFGGLSTGDYRVGFQLGCRGELDPGLFYESNTFFRGKGTLADATPVRVTEGSTRTGINSLQDGGASISGKVTDTSGKPLADICVDTYDAQGNLGNLGRTESDGGYAIDQFTAGDYRLKFSDCLNSDPTLIAEFYDDKASLEEAVPVSLTTFRQVSGIDAELALVKPEEPGPGPGPGPPLFTPKPAKLKVKVNGPAKVTQGKKATYRVRISNTGNARAKGVKLTVKGKRVLLRTKVGKITARTDRTVKFNLKPKKTGKTKLTFNVTSANADGQIVKRFIRVRE